MRVSAWSLELIDMYNPIRRNRNIGTENQGFGQDNRLVIPDSWRDYKVFYERLNSPIMIERKIHNKIFTFLVEPTLEDFKHACTVDDIEKIIRLLPVPDVLYIDLFVLRQPTRKQTILNYPWGRLCFYYEADQCTGKAIVLESQQLKKPIKRNKSLSPDQKKEIDRLRNDGHKIEIGKREIIIKTSINSCRNTQLFRTVPHEVGHYVDFIKSGERKFDSKTNAEKEAYAHRYADNFKENMIEQKNIPFSRILNNHCCPVKIWQLGHNTKKRLAILPMQRGIDLKLP